MSDQKSTFRVRLSDKQAAMVGQLTETALYGTSDEETVGALFLLGLRSVAMNSTCDPISAKAKPEGGQVGYFVQRVEG